VENLRQIYYNPGVSFTQETRAQIAQVSKSGPAPAERLIIERVGGPRCDSFHSGGLKMHDDHNQNQQSRKS
jgi:hypothetical protein